MKRQLFAIVCCVIALNSRADNTATNSVEKDLIKRFDLNGNGKIDIKERPPYLHELARIKRAEQDKKVREEWKIPRIDGFPATWDTNHDGKIDASEVHAGQSSRFSVQSMPQPRSIITNSVSNQLSGGQPSVKKNL